MRCKKVISFLVCYFFATHSLFAGINVVRSEGVSITGTDGITYIGTSGVSVAGADGYLSYLSNNISITDIDGVPMTGVDGVSVSGADGVTVSGTDGVSVTGADGVSISGADGVSISGTDGVSVTGADGNVYSAQYIVVQKPNGVSVSGADGVSIAGADGITVSGSDGVSVTGADGVTVSGTDGVSVSGADAIIGFGPEGVRFELVNPAGVSVSGADGVSVTGADGVSVTGADEIVVFGKEETFDNNGFQSLDPEIAILLNQITDDSNVNAVIAFHQYPTPADVTQLQTIGILGGTKYEVIPVIAVTATKSQLIEVSRMPTVRSIYGNRTIEFNTDPYLVKTGVDQVSSDEDLIVHNSGRPVSGRSVTVAVLDTGVNALHNDLVGRVVQNVRLVDSQSLPSGFSSPAPIENLTNTDLVSGHGTFVAGIIAGNGSSSGGFYDGVAPGANILGLSAGDYNLTHVLAGFDYVLKHQQTYNVRVINCSFSAETIYDAHDPVNIATKMLRDNGVSVVFSAGNKGDSSGTINPYAQAPWTIGVGSTNKNGQISVFSSRGVFAKSGPTIVAPGESIVSLRSLPSMTGVFGIAGADQNRLTTSELPYYTTASGTSFAAPQVAGAIALMVQVNADLTPKEIKEILVRSATPSARSFANEAGAGMLNTYGAVLEAAFPDREFGYFRAVRDLNSVSFETETESIFGKILHPGLEISHRFSIPEDTLRATSHIAWSFGANDLGLKIVDSDEQVAGESNFLNITALTGRIEKVSLKKPTRGYYSAVAYHTAGVGTSQEVEGAVEITRVLYGKISDIKKLSNAETQAIKHSLSSYAMMTRSGNFHPKSKVSRYELAETLVRAGYAPQYIAGSRMFTDVKSLTERNAVESVQNHPQGAFFFDSSPGSEFNPHKNVSRLVAAVAFVRAAGLEYKTFTTVLPPNVADAFDIPIQYRGHVAVALLIGFLDLRGKEFKPDKDISRLDMAIALSKF